MGEVTRVSMFDPASASGPLSPAQQEAQQTQQKAAAAQPAPQGLLQNPAPYQAPAELPSNFRSVADLAAAYRESQAMITRLTQERAQAAKAPVAGEAAPDAAQTPAGYKGLKAEDLDAFYGEWAQNGRLSEDTYQRLSTQHGIDRAAVDRYIEGEVAKAEGMRQQVYSVVGGQEQYERMAQWAGQAWNQNQAGAFQDALDSRDMKRILFAVQSMKAQYEAQMGFQEPLQLGGQRPGSTGVEPFQSMQQVVEAMKDQRYRKGDMAYHREVQARLAASPFYVGFSKG